MDPGVVRAGEQVSVVQLLHEGYEHMRAFDDVASSLWEGLRSMGVDAELVRGRAVTGRRSILLGAHTLPDQELSRLPRGTIVYNHEQIDPGSMLTPDRLRRFRRLGIWDYSRRNTAAWADAGIEAHFVPIGWSPGLRTIDRSCLRDIDVVFYGSINDRRRRVLEAISRRGARVEVAFGVYGEARDALIARARLVLNIQYYEARILEMVRLSYLFANEVPVVSETSPGIDAPPGFEDAAAFVGYDRLVSTTLRLLHDEAALADMARRGRLAMESWPWTRALAHVVEHAEGDGAAGGDAAVVLVARARLDDPVPTPTGSRPGLAEALSSWTDDSVATVGGSLGGLGPPPVVDPDDAQLAPQVAGATEWWRGPDGPRPGDVVEMAGAGLVAPFWAQVASRVGGAVRVELVVGSPVPAATAPGAATRAVLRWLADVLFSETLTRDLDRRIRVEADPVDVNGLPPALRFPAMQRAAQVLSILSSDPESQAARSALDAETERVLDAMSLYLPLLDELEPPP